MLGSILGSPILGNYHVVVACAGRSHDVHAAMPAVLHRRQVSTGPRLGSKASQGVGS